MVAWCFVILAVVGLERLFELHLSGRNAAWSQARGGLEFGRGHLGAMKVLHTGLLVGCALETYMTGGAYDRLWTPLCAAAVVLAQSLRYWCIISLGSRWNIRVIVVPHLPPVSCGPYRWLRHPNYVAVVLEGLALPLMFGAVRTAVLFSLFNALLLRRRIACESEAIAEVCGPYSRAASAREQAA